jgi:hypothetical protein
MSRTTTLRTMAMTARTTGEDDDDSKDDDSEDDGDDAEYDNHDVGNDDSGGGGGGKFGGEVGGVARSVAWLVAVFFAVGCLALTYRRNCTDTFGNKFILINWVTTKIGINGSYPDLYQNKHRINPEYMQIE